MVTAAGPPYNTPDMRDDEIILSQWLADDLKAGPGDKVSLAYLIPNPAPACSSKHRTFACF